MTSGDPSSRIRPLNVSRHAEGNKSGGDDADEDDEYDEEVICGQCDNPPVKVAANPRMPTQREIDEHCVTHLPHRSWCDVCIKARGREDAHSSRKEKGAKPIIAMDYKEFGEDADSEDKIKTIIVKDEDSGCLAAHVVEQKGSADQWAVQRVLDDIRMFGHTDIIMKGDGEPALVQVQREIVDKRSAGSVPQNPPAYDPQANGAAERGVQEFMNQMRAIKIGLEQREDCRVDGRVGPDAHQLVPGWS